jgi:hypothetical protein
MSLAAVVKTLEDNAYNVDTIKYRLSIAPDDQNTALEFCRIDDEITLILDFDKRTQNVISMGIYGYPDNPSRPRAERSVFVREVLEIELERLTFTSSAL